MKARLFYGDCFLVLKSLPSNSIDSIVTDPPYGLSYMGKKWDYSVPSVDIWRECLRVLKPGGHLLTFAGTRTQHRMAVNIEDAGFEIRDMIAWVYGQGLPKSHNLAGGWGTTLKPALEPITMARKPLTGTVAENFQEWATGALNIDECRIKTGSKNRWPANLIQDGSEEVLKLFPKTKSGSRKEGIYKMSSKEPNGYGFKKLMTPEIIGDSGSAARFFYCAKASKGERGEGNNHPTVKPVTLMKYLCRLVTPLEGTVLDPFMGSGTTGLAALSEGFRFIGVEQDLAYFEISKARLGV